MSNPSTPQPNEGKWAVTECVNCSYLLVESSAPFTGLPERLKGYRPGQGRSRPADKAPIDPAPPEDNKPAE
jgi:hypothetical protein